MQLADKPYAELIEAAGHERDGDLLVGVLKAAMVLPPQRAVMMLAACVVGQHMRCGARHVIWAFVEEARWKAL